MTDINPKNRNFEDIKSSVILIEPTNYNNSAEFEEALFDQLKSAKKKWPNRVIRLNLLDCGDILWVLVFKMRLSLILCWF